MTAYPAVPGWWYASVFMVCFAAACVCVKVWDYNMTIWALVIALLIAVIYLIPVGELGAICIDSSDIHFLFPRQG